MIIRALFAAVLMLLVSISSYAGTTRQISIACLNGGPSAVVFLSFDDDGQLIGASGIDCDGIAWSKQYNVYAGEHRPGPWIYSQTANELTVAAHSDITAQIIGLSANGGQPIGGEYNLNETGVNGDEEVVIDISSLPSGQYGVLVSKDGGVVDMLIFHK